jgi:hypothetical protein
MLSQAVDVLGRIGFTVEDVAMPIENLREIAELHPLVMRAEGAANHMNDMRAIRRIYTRSEKSSAGQISHSGDCIHPGAELTATSKRRAGMGLRRRSAARPKDSGATNSPSDSTDLWRCLQTIWRGVSPDLMETAQ